MSRYMTDLTGSQQQAVLKYEAAVAEHARLVLQVEQAEDRANTARGMMLTALYEAKP
jgi:hypothetical protein